MKCMSDVLHTKLIIMRDIFNARIYLVLEVIYFNTRKEINRIIRAKLLIVQ